jgi:hypothetical protein
MIEGPFLVDSVSFARCESHAVAAGCESRRGVLFIRSLVFETATGCSLPVKTIQSRSFAFVKCIYIPRTIELLPDQCFLSCHLLQSVSFESNGSLRRIETLAFSFRALKSVTLPRGVELLGPEFCAGCGSLSSVSFENDILLRQFESKLFFESSLESVIIPQKVLAIGPECFSECRSLSSISFENDSQLQTIEKRAFYGSSLKWITIPRNVLIIGSECFTSCRALSAISFQDDSLLRHIESQAFYSSSLAKLVIPKSVSYIDGSAFSDWRRVVILNEYDNRFLVDQSEFVLSIDLEQLVRYLGSSSVLRVPPNVEVIGCWCFSHCRHISRIYFQSDCMLKRIESNTFCYCSFKSIVVPEASKLLAIGVSILADCFRQSHAKQIAS